jgi:multiple sugar transport system permease protein
MQLSQWNLFHAFQRKSGRRWTFRPWVLLAYIVVAITAVISIFPFYWMLVNSLLSAHDAMSSTPIWWPDWQWANYARAWSLQPWLHYFANSLFIASYLIMKSLNWIDTYQAQIIPFAVSISGVFLVSQSLSSLPSSLWEAAQLDGCSRWKFLWQIAAPLARPALVVVALQVFIGSWNAFLWPYLVTNTDAVRPIEVGLQSFLVEGGTDPTALAAAAAFTTLPVLVLFLIAQRQFIEGISVGSTKG